MKMIASGILVSALAAMLLADCGGEEAPPPVGTPGSPAEPVPPTNPVPPTGPTGPSNPTPPSQPVTPTAVGTVQGAAASAQIGPAGGDDEPRVHNVAGFTRGNLPIDLRTGLIGLEYIPPRLQPDAAGTFSPVD